MHIKKHEDTYVYLNVFNPFQPGVAYLYSLETLENL